MATKESFADLQKRIRETEQQLELAGRLGIDYVQGFLVGEPTVRVVPLPEPRADFP